MLYELRTVNRRVARAQQVDAAVPAAVRVEARRRRGRIRKRTGVSVADAHLGAAIAHAAQDGITVVTSDPGDMRKMAQDRRVDIVAI